MWTEEAIRNLINTIYSKGELLSKATGGEFHVSEALLEEVKEYGATDGIIQLIESAGEGLRGVSIEGSNVKFTGFPETDDPLKARAFAMLEGGIAKTCQTSKVLARRPFCDNEKFVFRVWLLRLGLGGPEFKEERKMLYANLSGHVAFRTEKDKENWYARRKKKLRTQSSPSLTAISDPA